MKLIKIAFLISLFNFMVVGAVVMALKGENDGPTPPVVVVQSDLPIAPTIAPVKVIEKKVANKVKQVTDPFEAIRKKFSQATPVPTSQNVPQPTATTTNNSQPVATDNRCIIAIDGVKYDVSVFRKEHSGGDIFTCNTDMSAVFHSQHPNSFLQRMTGYKI
jgi:hypothetical protein